MGDYVVMSVKLEGLLGSACFGVHSQGVVIADLETC